MTRQEIKLLLAEQEAILLEDGFPPRYAEREARQRVREFLVNKGMKNSDVVYEMYKAKRNDE